MLQEILLSLAGHPSPLFNEDGRELLDNASATTLPALSSPERALLSTVALLSDLHAKIKKNAASIASENQSTICRNVASNILTVQLQRFMTKIVQVEKSILFQDSRLVGGYGIVPLSVVVGEFTPWTRRLEWLWKVTQRMKGGPASGVGTVPPCSGPSLIEFLRSESHTGYQDLKAMVVELIRVAESTWIQILSNWLLYGRLSSTGSEDFFIASVDSEASQNFEVRADLVPDFVPPQTAASVLFIGESLNNVRSHGHIKTTHTSSDPALSSVSKHLELLKTIKSPISSLQLENVVSLIRVSISQHLLSQLLPALQIVDLIQVLHAFLLLRRGTFAQSLIANAGRRPRQHHEQRSLVPIRKAGRQDTKATETELFASLSRTWSDLGSLQPGEEQLDEVLEKGREWIRLTARDSGAPDVLSQFASLVFALPVTFTLELPERSALALFLSKTDISAYSEVALYLLAIKRSQSRLASLWQNSALRRPRAQPPTNKRSGALEKRRVNLNRREHERSIGMRPYWATANKCHFIVAELVSFFQGELVSGHATHFISWLGSVTGVPDPSESKSRPGTSSGSKGGQSVPLRADEEPAGLQTGVAADPTYLAQAHKRFIEALRSSLLLDAHKFTKVLLRLLMLIDHYVALFGRLDATRRSLDLELQDDRADPLADHRKEEQEILGELHRSRGGIEDQLDALMEDLRSSATGADSSHDLVTSRPGVHTEKFDSAYVPWRAPSMDSLLMRLETTGPRVEPGTDHDEDDE